ncbi:MAG: cobalamin-dependent protein [Anaerolineales bacterium]|nr:cobalamin-dependent protein [Anaerolineales bacterium]
MSPEHAMPELVTAITELDEQGALSLVQSRLEAGDDPFAIMAACEAGMRKVGERYEERLYYLSGLIMAGEIFREVVEMLRPALEQRPSSPSAGRILLGTVQGDIHDIGKNMLGMLLTTHGFNVTDLGVDVPPEIFVARAIAEQPDVVCLSCLISSAYESMRITVEQLKEKRTAARMHLPILIGGGMIDAHLVRYIGADHWAVDAMDGVRLCHRLVAERALRSQL